MYTWPLCLTIKELILLLLELHGYSALSFVELRSRFGKSSKHLRKRRNYIAKQLPQLFNPLDVGQDYEALASSVLADVKQIPSQVTSNLRSQPTNHKALAQAAREVHLILGCPWSVAQAIHDRNQIICKQPWSPARTLKVGKVLSHHFDSLVPPPNSRQLRPYSRERFYVVLVEQLASLVQLQLVIVRCKLSRPKSDHPRTQSRDPVCCAPWIVEDHQPPRSKPRDNHGTEHHQYDHEDNRGRRNSLNSSLSHCAPLGVRSVREILA